MKIFLSWSKDLSLKIAKELKEWLGCVIQGADIFISSDDIRKGNRWNLEIAKQLDGCDFGIICLTKENLNSSWILFESGALSKSMLESNVCTILIGDLDLTDIEGPLSQFQHTKINKDDFKKLIKTINEKFGEKKLPDLTLDKVFETWWPQLENKIKHHMNTTPTEDKFFVKRSDKELLSEVLELARFIAQHLPIYSKEEGVLQLAETNVAHTQIRNTEDHYLLSPNGGSDNYPVGVKVYPICIEKDGKYKHVSCKITEGEIKIEEIESPFSTRGVIINLIFYDELGRRYWESTFQFHKGQTIVNSQLIDNIVPDLGMAIK